MFCVNGTEAILLCIITIEYVPGTNQYWATRVKFMKNNMDINRVRNPALLLKL